MKITTLAALNFFLLSGCASSGHFVDSWGFAENPFSVGEGNSFESAKAAAERAIPSGFEEDKAWSSRISGCAKHGEVALWDAKKQTYGICPSGRYREEIPLVTLDPSERNSILAYRSSKLSKQYRGQGETYEAAKQDLLSKLPKNAVVDSWSIGCIGKISIQPDTGHTFCDKSEANNQREVIAYVREPNVDKSVGASGL